MNTTEINGSAWATKYYVAVAVPLTVVTVLVPLIALPAFNVALRLLKSGQWIRETFDWGFIPTFFIMNLIRDINVYTEFLPRIASAIVSALDYTFGIAVMVSVTYNFGKSFKSLFRQHSTSRGGPLQATLLLAAVYKKWHWWPLFYVIAIASHFISFFVQSFVELPAFLIYFFMRLREARRKRPSHVII